MSKYVRVLFVALAVGFGSLVVAQPANALVASPATGKFRSVALNRKKVITVAVTFAEGYGFGGFHIGSGGLTPPWHLDFSTCFGVVGPASCKVTLSFTPTVPGPVFSNFIISECLLFSGPCFDYQLNESGNGVIKGRVAPDSHDFGRIPVNTTKTQTIALTIDNGFEVLPAVGSGVSAPFSLDAGTCAGFVGPGNCTVTQSFTPTT